MIDIDKILELEAAATKEGWEYDPDDGSIHHRDGGCICFIQPHGSLRTIDKYGEDHCRADGRLIEAMRNNIKELCLRLKEAEETLQFYADEEYQQPIDEWVGEEVWVDVDAGLLARELLAKWRESK